MAILVQDSFNRTNSTTSLGVADTGQTYEIFGGGTWGIYNNQAYSPGTGNPNGAVIDVGQSDISIQVKYTGSNLDNFASAFRVDTTAKTFLYFDANTGSLKYRNASSYVNIATTSKIAQNDVIKIVAQGSTITVYRNDTLIITATSTFNQTLTKHGFANWRGGGNLNGLWDDLLIESLGGTPTGTDGSTAFDLRQSLFADSAVNADSRQSFYSDSVTAFDSVQAIYSDSASGYDTRLTLYQDGALTFDTLQEFFSDGIIGSTPFDLRVVLYADNSAVFDSRQAWYMDGVSAVDLTQQFYQVGGISSDMKLVLYADAFAQYDAKQSLYSDAFVKADTTQRYYTDGNIDFDTLQAILDDWAQYNEVIRIVLNISRNQTATLGITQRKQSELNL